MPKRSRQTVSFLTKRFRQIGLEPDSKHGQNFLIDLNLVELLERTADIQPNDVILEVGTGTGSLTAMMAEKAAAVVSVEIDSHLHQMAREELEGQANVELLLMDALRNKNNFQPDVIAAVRRHLEAAPGRQFKLAANLPYNVATPIISNLLLWDTPPCMMVATIQKELAERIVAEPETKDYGSFSVWIQSQCDAEIVRIMGPSVFWPRPKVHSAIVKITRSPEKCARIDNLPFFHQFVRAMFFHRRKFLRSVLISGFKTTLAKSDVDEVLAEMNYGPDTRAEQLSVESIIELWKCFAKRTDRVG